MKKIIFHSCYEELNSDNFLFKNENVDIGDNLLRPFIQIKDKLAVRKINVDTDIATDHEDVQCYVFIDEPDYENFAIKEIFKLEIKKYLIHLESPIIKKIEYEKHKLFEKIFTYNDSLVDNKKYIKINYSFDVENKVLNRKRNNFCVLLSSNKKSSDKNELYSLRINDADIFYGIKKNSINLYGFGWGEYLFPPIKPYSIMNRFHVIRKLVAKIRYPYYVSSVKRKKDVLENYKFSICYENVMGINGYITEKIFDSMMSGCIPIYLGAPNIDSYVPQECFIDRSRFKSANDLYTHLINLSENEYENYLEAIKNYLGGEEINKFSCSYFADTIANNII